MSTTPLDLQTMEQLRLLESQDPGLIRELLRLFVADAPRQMRLINSGYTGRDPELVQQSAHFLRSGALALGLTWLAEHSNALEHLALDQYGSPEADQQVVQLRAELHRVLLFLLKRLKTG